MDLVVMFVFIFRSDIIALYKQRERERERERAVSRGRVIVDIGPVH